MTPFMTMRWLATYAAFYASRLAGPFYANVIVARAPVLAQRDYFKADWPTCETPVWIEFAFDESESPNEISPRLRRAVSAALGLNYVPTWWSPDPPMSMWDFVLPIGESNA